MQLLHIACEIPVGHALFPDIGLLGELSLADKLLQLVPVEGSGLLPIDTYHIAYLWRSLLHLHTRHLRSAAHSRHLRGSTHTHSCAHLRLLAEGVDAVVGSIVEHAGTQVGLMGSQERLLRLQAAGTLHLLTLNAHSLTLVLKVHVLYLFLPAQLHLLLTLHGVEVKRRLHLQLLLIEIVL